MLGGQISRMTKWGTYKIIETMLVFVQLRLIFKKIYRRSALIKLISTRLFELRYI